MQWADLMTQLTNTYPDAAARVICDVLNEPDFGNLRWEAQPDAGLPGMKDMYLNAWDAIYNITNGERMCRKVLLCMPYICRLLQWSAWRALVCQGYLS